MKTPENNARPACEGQHKLFDSVHPAAHAEAKAICATCPVIAACREHRRAVQEAAYSSYGPRGTWAGELFGAPSSKGYTATERIAMEAAYDEADIKRAHRQYNRGDRSDWAVTGHRIYDRNRRRAKTAADRAVTAA